MKKVYKALLGLTIVIFIALALPSTVSAAPNQDSRTVLGESYTLESGRILDGDLNVIGGVVNIEKDATVNGDVFVLGGLVTVDGTIKGDLRAIGGTVTLEENAVIKGDLISPASFINRNKGAAIQGDQRQGWTDFDLPFFYRAGLMRTPRLRILPILNRLVRETGITLVLVALGALLLLIMPKPAETMTQALVQKPWSIFGYGTLTALVMFIVGIILTITICLIPVAVLIGLTVGLATLVGWLTLGYELGKRIAASIFKSAWHPVLSAAVGNLVIYLSAVSLNLLPCLGGFLVFIVMLFGLGMTVVTLFGTNPYPRQEGQGVEERIVLFESETPEEIDRVVVKTSEVDKTIDEEIFPVRPIEALDLDTRIINVLKDAGLTTIGSLLERLEEGEQALLDINGFGPKSLVDLKIALRQKGYVIPESSGEDSEQ
jgi:hypothetical protein